MMRTPDSTNAETIEQSYIAVICLDSDVFPRQGATNLSAAELAIELLKQARGSCAGVVSVTVAVQ